MRRSIYLCNLLVMLSIYKDNLKLSTPIKGFRDAHKIITFEDTAKELSLGLTTFAWYLGDNAHQIITLIIKIGFLAYSIGSF